MIELKQITIIADGAGNFTVTFPATGALIQYRYSPGTLATGADVTVAGANTGKSFIALVNAGTATIDRAPRQPVHDAAGTPSLYAAGGEPVEDYIYAGGEQLTLTVAQGGTANVGTLYLWFKV